MAPKLLNCITSFELLDMNFKILLITILLQCVHSWVPPGMNSYQEPPHTPSPSPRGGHAADQLGHGIHLDDHDHDHKKEEVAGKDTNSNQILF